MRRSDKPVFVETSMLLAALDRDDGALFGTVSKLNAFELKALRAAVDRVAWVCDAAVGARQATPVDDGDLHIWVGMDDSYPCGTARGIGTRAAGRSSEADCPGCIAVFTAADDETEPGGAETGGKA